MQACTHILAGAGIEAAARRFLGRGAPGLDGRRALGTLALAAIAAAGPVSHVLLDAAARMTYHVARPLFDDPAWVSIHAGYAVLTLLLAWRLRSSALGIAAALLPDLDWVVRALPRPPWTPGGLHAGLASLPGLAQACAAIERLPSFRDQAPAALPELALGLGAALWLFRRRAAAASPPRATSASDAGSGTAAA